MSDMEREGYQKRINDLLIGLQSLLDANVAMGEKIKKLEQIATGIFTCLITLAPCF